MKYCLFYERNSEHYPARMVECSMCVWTYKWWYDTVPYVPTLDFEQVEAYQKIRVHAREHDLPARIVCDVLVP